jgi:enoyl-CoA hydratase/carnithine racemase
MPNEDAILLCEIAAGVATLTLNRPAVLNALNGPQRRGLTEAFLRLDSDPAVRAVVLRGAGRSFCAGQDQKESVGFDAAGAAGRIDEYAALYAAIRALGKPLIAALHGHVAGAGLQLALLCDLRIAAAETRCGMTEFAVGSAAIMGSALLLPIVGETVMKRLVMMADFISAEVALGCGLVTELHPATTWDSRVAALAAEAATRAPLGVRLTKNWWRQMSQPQFDAMVLHAHHAHAENFAAGGLSQGARRFVEVSRSGPRPYG